MAGAESLLLLLLLPPPPSGLAFRAAWDPFAPQLGDTRSCQDRCRNLAQRRGAAQAAVLSACSRGCRLFSICRFVAASVEPNATRAECEAACSEAYGQAEEQLACIEGCRRQMPEMESQEEKQIPEPPPAALSVLDLFSNLCSDLVSSAQSFLSSTWTYYLQADDGKVVVFQSQPVMESLMLKTPQPKQMEAVWLGSDPDNLDSHSDPGEKLEKPARKEAKGKARLQTSEPPQPADFLGCMSKRSGLPRWILAVCLFFSVLVMLWLSCASLVTAPDQHIRTQPLSIAGDKDYLEKLEHPLALPPVLAIAVCPAESDPEAGPLPLKVELDRTAL
ncbi:transmembrane protein 59-like [Ornithorhynchus anatinus]|uniref:transmembrane protein 59-like n=1 Tax=Ornithorhynchus anatinus TaxID=9258 RepID=UPI0010A8CB28|nr:transmembrane protein 59-like [Ornithorhynchus anatinus]